MDPDTRPEGVTRRRVLYDLPGTDEIAVRRDIAIETSDAGSLVMDSYLPPGTGAGGPPPVVVMVAGYPDAGVQRVLGCRFKEMAFTVSWARLIAASGIAAVTYSNRSPVADLNTLLDYLQKQADPLGIDGRRLGVWASSGSVPLALSAMMTRPGQLKCAALYYGYMLDLDGTTAVAEAAARFGFATGAATSIEDLPGRLPLFVVRSGQDQMPGLNDCLDRFVARALAANLPLTLVNHPTGPHAFDLYDDSETTREIVGQTLGFLKFHLLAT